MSDSVPDPWPAPSVAELAGPLDAVVRLPGSKSLTNRFLLLAALAEDDSRLRAPLRSRDTLLMAAGLRTLGARIEDLPAGQPGQDDWHITPGRLTGGGRVECGLAGTVMRFLPPVAALADGPVLFDGDEAARTRPMGAVIGALRSLGVQIDASGDHLPLTVHGRRGLAGGTVTLDASASSQFVSALLLMGARCAGGLTVVHEGPPLPSRPHIEMTVEVLRDAGVDVDDADPDRWRVEPGGIHPLDVVIEPDLTNAAPFLAAALVAGGRVRIPDWPQHTTQAGDAIRDVLDMMGADVSLQREGLTVTGAGGPGAIAGIDVDLRHAGELTPAVAALAALADGPSRIRGVGHLRGHETDRLAALSAEITRLGGQAEVLEDGLLITPRPLTGTRLRSYADHRMATAGAVLGLAVPGTSVEDIATTGKTLPDFPAMWRDALSQTAPVTPAVPGPGPQTGPLPVIGDDDEDGQRRRPGRGWRA